MVIAKTLWAKAVGYGVQGIGSPLSLGRKMFRFFNPSRRGSVIFRQVQFVKVTFR